VRGAPDECVVGPLDGAYPYSDGVVCRRVAESDLADLLPLVRAYCEFNGVARTDAELLLISRALIADPDHQGVQLIARGRDQRAVGFATLVWTWATWAGGRIGIMGDLYVAAPARRSRVGRELIDACRRECQRIGGQGLMWTTAKDNLAARALYESVGARSREWVDYWLDA
jgi:GNAT superfamily N-acetyltransferase